MRRRLRRVIRQNLRLPGPPPLEPIWPLPRCASAPSEEEIRARFAPPNLWHYDFAFEGGLNFPSRHATHTPYLIPDKALIRFRHFMPWLLEAAGGTLSGKRVLDIGCSSGFWSIQCALLGAQEVIGFDARREQIEQADFLRAVVGANNAKFRVLDFWEMNPEALGGTFDVVLNLALLPHLADPLEALERTKRMARPYILLDMMVCPKRDSVIRLVWEQSNDIHLAAASGMVAWPSKAAMELMFRHLGLSACKEIPIRTSDLHGALLLAGRGTWLIDVRTRRLEGTETAKPLPMISG